MSSGSTLVSRDSSTMRWARRLRLSAVSASGPAHAMKRSHARSNACASGTMGTVEWSSVSMPDNAGRRARFLGDEGCLCLIAVSVEHRGGHEFLAAVAAGGDAIGGAPVRKRLRVDTDAQHDMAIGLEAALHLLGHLQPL